MDVLTLRTLLTGDKSDLEATLRAADKAIDDFINKQRGAVNLGLNVGVGGGAGGRGSYGGDPAKIAAATQAKLNQIQQTGQAQAASIQQTGQAKQVAIQQQGQAKQTAAAQQAAQQVANIQAQSQARQQAQTQAHQQRLIQQQQTFHQRQAQMAAQAAARAALRPQQTWADRMENLQRTGYYNVAAGGTLVATTTAPVAAGATLAAKSAIEWKSSFAGVRKTVNATEADLQRIAHQLRQMAAGPNPIPINVNELNGIAEAAGQLGIHTPAIIGFTRTMADLGVATNMTSDQAATSLARLANITEMPQRNFDRLGSTVVDLGNKFATTEAEIVNMSLRIAGAGKQIGMSEAQILSYATALSSVGVRSDAGGSAISRVFINVAQATRQGGEELEIFARLAGQTTEQFKQSFQQDAAQAVAAFIAGLKRAGDAGENTFTILEKLGMTEIRVRDALLRTAGAGDLLARALDTGTSAWQQNSALTEEAGKRYQTTESQLIILQNRVRETAIDLSEEFLPAINEVAESVGSGLPSAIKTATAAWNDLPDIAKDIIGWGGAALMAAGPMMLMAGNTKILISALGTLGKIAGVGRIAGALTGAAGAGSVGAAAAGALPAAAAVGAAVVGYQALSKAIEETFEAQKKVEAGANDLDKALEAALEFIPSESKYLKAIQDIRDEMAAAGTDVEKVDAAVRKLTELKHTIQLDTSIDPDISTVVSHEIKKAQALASQQQNAIRVAVRPFWTSVVGNLGEALGIHNQNFGVDRNKSLYENVTSSDYYKGVGTIVDPVMSWLTPQGGNVGAYDGMRAAMRGSEYTRQQRALAAAQHGPTRPSYQSFGPPSPTADQRAQMEVDAARARLLAKQNTGGQTGTPPVNPEESTEDIKKAADAARELAQVQKDALGDAAKAWREYGRAVDAVADKQIEKIRGVRDGVIDMVQSLESRLAAIDTRLMGPFFQRTAALRAAMGDERLLNSVYGSARGISRGAERRATAYDSQRELISFQDGVVSSKGGYTATSTTGMAVAQRALARESSGEARRFHKRCQALAETTMWSVTNAYNGILQPKGSALQTLRRFQKAGLAQPYTAGMAIPPGSLAYSETLGGGSGHVATVGPNGEFLDQYGKNKLRQSNYQYFVPPPGIKSQTFKADKGAPKTIRTLAPGAGPDMPPDYDALIEQAQAPEFKRSYTQFAQSTLKEMLKLHPVEREGNKIRRETLLDLVKMNPKLHEYAAAKGLAGKAAEAWVQQVRASLYAMANYTEFVTNMHEAEQRNAQMDEDRKRSRVSEIESMKERSKELEREGELLSNNAFTLKQIQQIREEEKFFNGQMAHHQGQGASFNEARGKSLADLETFKTDRTRQETNKDLEDIRKWNDEVLENAITAHQKLTDDSIAANFETVNRLMSDTQLSAETVAQVLGDLHSRIGKGELFKWALPDAAQMANINAIAAQNDARKKFGDLESRVKAEAKAASDELMSAYGHDPIQAAEQAVKNFRLELGKLNVSADDAERMEAAFKGIVGHRLAARDLAANTALQEARDARGLLGFAPGFERDQAAYRQQLGRDGQFKGKPDVINEMVNERAMYVRQENAQSWFEDMQHRIAQSQAASSLDRWMLDLKKKWKHDGFTEEEIRAMMPFERALAQAQEMKDVIRSHAEDLRGILSSGIKKGFTDPLAGLQEIVSSLTDRLMTTLADNYAERWTERILGGKHREAGGTGPIFEKPALSIFDLFKSTLPMGGALPTTGGVAGPVTGFQMQQGMMGGKGWIPPSQRSGMPGGIVGALLGAAGVSGGGDSVSVGNVTLNATSIEANVSRGNFHVASATGLGGEAGSSSSKDQVVDALFGMILS